MNAVIFLMRWGMTSEVIEGHIRSLLYYVEVAWFKNLSDVLIFILRCFCDCLWFDSQYIVHIDGKSLYHIFYINIKDLKRKLNISNRYPMSLLPDILDTKEDFVAGALANFNTPLRVSYSSFALI